MKYIDHRRSERIINQARRHMAQSEAARHSASTAIANWSNGYTYAEVQLARALPPSPQSQWYDSVQADFIAWLTAGGFAQADAGDTPAAAAQGRSAADSAPAGAAGSATPAEPADGAAPPQAGGTCHVCMRV
ncbi:MAG: hypothetical protein V4754_13440 [Pseudomonadota bacterium]